MQHLRNKSSSGHRVQRVYSLLVAVVTALCLVPPGASAQSVHVEFTGTAPDNPSVPVRVSGIDGIDEGILLSGDAEASYSVRGPGNLRVHAIAVIGDGDAAGEAAWADEPELLMVLDGADRPFPLDPDEAPDLAIEILETGSRLSATSPSTVNLELDHEERQLTFRLPPSSRYRVVIAFDPIATADAPGMEPLSAQEAESRDDEAGEAEENFSDAFAFVDIAEPSDAETSVSGDDGADAAGAEAGDDFIDAFAFVDISETLEAEASASGDDGADAEGAETGDDPIDAFAVVDIAEPSEDEELALADDGLDADGAASAGEDDELDSLFDPLAEIDLVPIAPLGDGEEVDGQDVPPEPIVATSGPTSGHGDEGDFDSFDDDVPLGFVVIPVDEVASDLPAAPRRRSPSEIINGLEVIPRAGYNLGRNRLAGMGMYQIEVSSRLDVVGLSSVRASVTTGLAAFAGAWRGTEPGRGYGRFQQSSTVIPLELGVSFEPLRHSRFSPYIGAAFTTGFVHTALQRYSLPVDTGGGLLLAGTASLGLRMRGGGVVALVELRHTEGRTGLDGVLSAGQGVLSSTALMGGVGLSFQ